MWGELSHGGETLCASAFCASLVIWFSLHFVVGLGHVSVGGWYHGSYTLGVLLLCARDVASCFATCSPITGLCAARRVRTIRLSFSLTARWRSWKMFRPLG